MEVTVCSAAPPGPALLQGSRYAAAALIDRAVGEARALVGGRSPLVMLTGGGAPSVRAAGAQRLRSVPDLVLRGLAALCAEPRAPDQGAV